MKNLFLCLFFFLGFVVLNTSLPSQAFPQSQEDFALDEEDLEFLYEALGVAPEDRNLTESNSKTPGKLSNLLKELNAIRIETEKFLQAMEPGNVETLSDMFSRETWDQYRNTVQKIQEITNADFESTISALKKFNSQLDNPLPKYQFYSGQNWLEFVEKGSSLYLQSLIHFIDTISKQLTNFQLADDGRMYPKNPELLGDIEFETNLAAKYEAHLVNILNHDDRRKDFFRPLLLLLLKQVQDPQDQTNTTSALSSYFKENSDKLGEIIAFEYLLKNYQLQLEMEEKVHSAGKYFFEDYSEITSKESALTFKTNLQKVKKVKQNYFNELDPLIKNYREALGITVGSDKRFAGTHYLTLEKVDSLYFGDLEAFYTFVNENFEKIQFQEGQVSTGDPEVAKRLIALLYKFESSTNIQQQAYSQADQFPYYGLFEETNPFTENLKQ